MTLSQRTFMQSTHKLIETLPLAMGTSLYLRIYARSDARLYELWRGIYKGRLISQFIVKNNGERIDLV